MPAILHGSPGSGKTLVAGKLLHAYADNPARDENGRAIGFLYLAPTADLVREAHQNYTTMRDFFSMESEPLNASFMTYMEFFKASRTLTDIPLSAGTKVEFTDFEAWYNALNKVYPFSAHDCWLAFRICSFYADKSLYEALSDLQCGVPKAQRAAIYHLYQACNAHCETEGLHSKWITRFKNERYGFIVADESQTQSGSISITASSIAVLPLAPATRKVIPSTSAAKPELIDIAAPRKKISLTLAQHAHNLYNDFNEKCLIKGELPVKQKNK